MIAKPLNLALQGGGSHGAFAWGVLDRLLAEPSLRLDGISAVSAGAMNAAVLLSGWLEGGHDGARENLDRLWQALGVKWPMLPKQKLALAQGDDTIDGSLPPVIRALFGISRYLSPAQLNPMDINPLRDIIENLVDIERINNQSDIKLFVGATQVSTGNLRVFTNGELSYDVLLASACIPVVHNGIEIDDELYWDGGFSANPAISPLIHECKSQDILLVLLAPIRVDHELKSSKQIAQRMQELSFNTSFMREMREITLLREQIARSRWFKGRTGRRYHNLKFHVIEETDLMSRLSFDSRMNTHANFLQYLKAQGELQAEEFLSEYAHNVGKHSSIELAEWFT